jgi:hypothetical protein
MVSYASGNGIDSCALAAFYDDFGPFALARAKDNGRSRAGGPSGRATTMGVMLKTEFATAQLRSEKKNRGRRDDAKGCNLLPIHKAKIAVCGDRATGCFGGAMILGAAPVCRPSANYARQPHHATLTMGRTVTRY